jgi:ubiquinone/menaquinone biosynthesis C-methylase UbiE
MTEPDRPDWNSFARANASERWKKLSAAMGSDVTRALVTEARITPGLTVLDVASGTGEPAISIACAMNGTGNVIATDISEGPLKIAQQRAKQRELTNIEFQKADAMSLPFGDVSFDRITSRLGVMFFPDPRKAVQEFHRVLKHGGQVSLLAWGSIDQPYFATTVGTVQRLLEKPFPESGKKMFKFADPQSLRALYEEAGFKEINVRSVDVDWTWPGSPEDLWDYFQDVTVPFKPLLDAIPAERKSEVDAEVVREISRYSDGKQIEFGASIVLATALKT